MENKEVIKTSPENEIKPVKPCPFCRSDAGVRETGTKYSGYKLLCLICGKGFIIKALASAKEAIFKELYKVWNEASDKAKKKADESIKRLGVQ